MGAALWPSMARLQAHLLGLYKGWGGLLHGRCAPVVSETLVKSLMLPLSRRLTSRHTGLCTTAYFQTGGHSRTLWPCLRPAYSVRPY